MAKDGDRHQLGDPISRMADDPALLVPSLDDNTPPAQLSEQELRRQLANLHLIVAEAGLRGTPEPLTAKARRRLAELDAEYQRRGLTG